jgi:6-phosphogluconolactonase
VLPDAASAGARAARLVADAARAAVQARGRFLLALSGGDTAWPMIRALAAEDVPWGAVHVFQVDERVAPAGHADRNLTHILESLAGVALAPSRLHAMPVEEADLPAAAARYEAALRAIAGAPPILDLVHLGLGEDGHTASLVPDDPVLEVEDRDVALAGPYQDRLRMTLTYPPLDRARTILWVVTGAAKAPALARVEAGDRSVPGGRVRSGAAVLVADAAAAGGRGGA